MTWRESLLQDAYRDVGVVHLVLVQESPLAVLIGGLNSYKLEDKNLIFCLKYLQVLFDFHKAQMGVLVKRDWTEGEIVEAVGDDQSCRDLWIFPSRK